MAGIDELLGIMARLRDPEGGCPWDLEQDFASISPHTIEEAYEVDDAIARGDLEALRDELGDLLFQVVFQARIAQERGLFDFEAVVDSIRAKLIRRHPHVFAGAATPTSAAAQVDRWEEIKAAERRDGAAARAGTADPFSDIPRSLPALMRSRKILERIERLTPGAERSRSGSELAIDAALAAVAGTATAARDAVAFADGEGIGRSDPSEGRASRADRDRLLSVVGTGIRAWVELARRLGIDPEQALRTADDAAIDAAGSDAHQAGSSRFR